MRRTHPRSRDTALITPPRATDQLGRATADVDDEVVPPGRLEVGRGSGMSQATLLVSCEELGVDPRGAARCTQEFLAVARVAHGRGRDQTRTDHPVVTHDPAVLLQHGHGPPDGLGIEEMGRVDPLAEAGDAQAPLECPSVPVDDQQPGGVGPAVDRAEGPRGTATMSLA